METNEQKSTQDTPQDTPNATHIPMPHKRRRWLGIAIATVVVLVGGIAATLVLTNKDAKQSTATPDQPQASSSADANGLITKQTLECVPRGHDYYRTNNALHVDAANPTIAYVAIEYKGLFKTTDGGKTWQQSDKGIRGYAHEADATKKCVQEPGRIIANPKDPSHLLFSRVETPSTVDMIFGETAGVYESRDASATWRQLVTKGMNASGSRAIAFDPKQPATIYYGINNGKPSFRGPDEKGYDMLFNKTGILYKSTNSGSAWEELPTGAEEGLRATAVFVDDKNSSNILLATFSQSPQGGGVSGSQKGLLRTTDGGKTWQSTSLGDAIVEAAVAPQKFEHVYVPTQNTTGIQKAYYSTDGKTFKQAEHYMIVARYDPHTPAGTRLLGYDPYGSPAGVYESTDAGKSWVKYGTTPPEVDGNQVRISEIVWSPSDKNIVYMSGSAGYVWKSTDGGKTWATVMTLDTVGGLNKNKDGSTKSREKDQ